MAGRPTLYREEYTEQALKLCRLGATDRELADFFDVSEQTINAWKDAHPEFLVSLKDGKAKADAEVGDKLFRRATGYSHEAVKVFLPSGTTEPIYAPYIERYAPDTTACIFWLKNRRPDLWRDVQGREHAVEMKSPQLSLEERHARSRRLLDEVFAEVSAKAKGVSCGNKAEGA
jgi:hypothetical protein